MRQSLRPFFTRLVLVTLQCSYLTPTEYALVHKVSITSIQYTLSLFSIAIDLKPFDLLWPLTRLRTPRAIPCPVSVPAIKPYISREFSRSQDITQSRKPLYDHDRDRKRLLRGIGCRIALFGTENASNLTFSSFTHYLDELVKSHGWWMI